MNIRNYIFHHQLKYVLRIIHDSFLKVSVIVHNRKVFLKTGNKKIPLGHYTVRMFNLPSSPLVQSNAGWNLTSMYFYKK